MTLGAEKTPKVKGGVQVAEGGVRMCRAARYSEAAAFARHPYYIELMSGYRNSKADPGARFMACVRAAVTDLSLAGLP